MFLSSSRFGKPLTKVTRHAFPFLLIIATAVLRITYVESMSVGVLRLFGKG